MEQPFGVWRDNFHAAIIAAAIYNVNRAKDSKPIEPSAFMLVDRKEHSKKELGAAIKALTAMALPTTKKALKKALKKSHRAVKEQSDKRRDRNGPSKVSHKARGSKQPVHRRS